MSAEDLISNILVSKENLFFNIQGVPSIGTHFRFQFLNFLIVLSQKSNSNPNDLT